MFYVNPLPCRGREDMKYQVLFSLKNNLGMLFAAAVIGALKKG